jgi:hypothetical protein
MKQARAALARDVAANMAREYVSKNPLVTKALWPPIVQVQ